MPSAAGAKGATPSLQEARYRDSRRVTVVGAAVNLVLAAAKIAFGIVGQSQALVADGVHSLSDLVSDVMVWWAAKHGSRHADESHPYGHARIETAVTVGLGVLLILVAAGILIDAVTRLFEVDRLLHPGYLALVVAAVSVLAKEVLYHYTLAVARRHRSNMLRANAWHHRSDAVSSIIVVVGVAGAMAGLYYLDALAAAAVALMIAKIGWDLAWQSLKELVDTALDAERVAEIRERILAVDGVKQLHMLRTRRMGPDALVDVHILVHPKCSVSEGHQISETVRAELIRAFDEVTDVMVHIDPEDDEAHPVNADLPLREELLERLRVQWRDIPEAQAIEKATLHYLKGRVQVDLLLPLSVLRGEVGEEHRRLTRLFQDVAGRNKEVARIDLYYH